MAYDLTKLLERLPRDVDLEAAQARDAEQGKWDRVTDSLYSAFTRTPYKAVDRGPGQAEQLQRQRAGTLQALQGAEAAQGFADENDPDSESTRIARQYAAQIGVTVPEGATYASMKRTLPMLSQLVEQRKAEAKLQAEQAAMEKKRLEKEADDLRNRDWHVEDRDINNTAAMERARVMAAQRAGLAKEKTDEDKVEKLSKAVPEEVRLISTKLEELAKSVGNFEEANKTPIPGQGPIEGRVKNLPLIGPWLESEEGKKADQSVFGIVSQLLKLQSGAAVSEKEVARKMTELGFGQDAGPQSFRRGLRNLRKELSNTVKQKYSGYKPGVVKTYEERGGVSPEHIEGIGAKKPSVSMRSPEGEEYEFELDDPELEQARAAGWAEVP